jgi:hypothetical protein
MRGTGREGERGVAVTLLGSGASETNIMGLFVYIVGAVQRGGVWLEKCHLIAWIPCTLPLGEL